MLITLEPETVECLLSSRPQSGASPSAMTHHDLDLSIHFPFITSFAPCFIPIICTNKPSTLDPGCADTIVPPYLHLELNCSSPRQVFFQPYLSGFAPFHVLSFGCLCPFRTSFPPRLLLCMLGLVLTTLASTVSLVFSVLALLSIGLVVITFGLILSPLP